MNTLFSYAFLIGSAQGFLLVIFLLRKKENIIANRLLATTLFFFAIDLILEAATVTGEIRKLPFLIGLMQTFPYLYGPAIYLYVIFITRGISKFNLKYLLHYLPFLLVQIYCLFFFYFKSLSYQLLWAYQENSVPWHITLISYITPIYGGFYIVIAVYEAVKFNRELKSKFSSIDKYYFSWLKFLLVGAILLWITAMTMSALQLFLDKEIRPELVSYLAISIFIYSMAYKGLKNPEVRLDKSEIDLNENKINSYKKSGLKEDDANKYLKNLLKVMDEQKPYKNEKLSLADLSKLIGISTHNLSEIINTKIEQNFYDFINSYRVEEVKRLIAGDKEGKYSLLAHGFEAGFSSKSAYYSSFKKFTKMTPAQYRNQER